MVLELGNISHGSLNKSSPSGDSFGQWTLQPLRKETKEGLVSKAPWAPSCPGAGHRWVHLEGNACWQENRQSGST